MEGVKWTDRKSVRLKMIAVSINDRQLDAYTPRLMQYSACAKNGQNCSQRKDGELKDKTPTLMLLIKLLLHKVRKRHHKVNRG
jgi:hypothetical protein